MSTVAKLVTVCILMTMGLLTCAVAAFHVYTGERYTLVVASTIDMQYRASYHLTASDCMIGAQGARSRHTSVDALVSVVCIEEK